MINTYTKGYQDSLYKLAGIINKDAGFGKLRDVYDKLRDETDKNGNLTPKAQRLLFGPVKNNLPELLKEKVLIKKAAKAPTPKQGIKAYIPSPSNLAFTYLPLGAVGLYWAASDSRGTHSH